MSLVQAKRQNPRPLPRQRKGPASPPGWQSGLWAASWRVRWLVPVYREPSIKVVEFVGKAESGTV